MGERAGYRIRQGDKVSHMMRKQLYVGGTTKDFENLCFEIAETLGGNPGGGGSALRNDLNIQRMTAALYHVLYTAPFDRICEDANCDITDHGIFEIEFLSWEKWQVNHYVVVYEGNKVGEKEVLGTVDVVEGGNGKDILKFTWNNKYDL